MPLALVIFRARFLEWRLAAFEGQEIVRARCCGYAAVERRQIAVFLLSNARSMNREPGLPARWRSSSALRFPVEVGEPCLGTGILIARIEERRWQPDKSPTSKRLPARHPHATNKPGMP